MRRLGLRALLAIGLAAVVVGGGVLTATGYYGETRRASTDSAGYQGNADAGTNAISPDGEHVAFESGASNLVPGDNNSVPDVFLKTLTSNETTLVSAALAGAAANGSSKAPVLSATGDMVAFQSTASNLVPGETGMAFDVFVRNMVSGETTRASSSPSGVQGNAASTAPSISSTGSIVVFQSTATNLVSGDTNVRSDIFARDLVTGQMTRLSTSSNGTEANGESYAPAISGDGSKVAFESDASNLVTGDTKGVFDIFVKDLASGETTRVSRSATNVEANGDSRAPAISNDGRYVVFESDATNLVADDTNTTTDIFMKDLVTGAVTRVSCDSNRVQANGSSFAPSISADDKFVTFQSQATNLVSGDTNQSMDVFVWNRVNQQITRVSCNSQGVQGNGSSGYATLSSDGRYVAFGSSATNLVLGDGNAKYDVFVNEVDSRPTVPVGAPTKPKTVYTWASFTSTGTITPHSGETSVTIECARSMTAAPVYRYIAKTTSGGGVYSSSAVKLPSVGDWYLRAKHEDAAHRTSYSPWTKVYVSSAPIITAPKVPTSMYAGRTYSVYGTIKPRHTSSTYIVVYAYKLVGSGYVYKTHFHVKITNTGQAYNTTKYIAAVKLTSKGYWKLRVKHTAHGVEGLLYSAYSYRFKVK